MPGNDCIVDEKLKAELATLKSTHKELSEENRVLLRQRVPFLSEALEGINTQNTSYSQIRTITRLFADAREFEFAFRLFLWFKGTAVYKASIRSTGDDIPPNEIARVAQYLTEKELRILAETRNKRFFEFSEKQRLGQALLRHLIKKNENMAEDMLMKYPRLLGYRGNVIVKDENCRELKFKDVNALDWVLHQSKPEAVICNDSTRDIGLDWAYPEAVRSNYKNLGQKLLHHVVKGNQLDVVTSIIEHNPKLQETKDLFGRGITLLIWAAFNGHINLVNYLVSKLANTDHVMIALCWAVRRGHAHVVASLLKAGDDCHMLSYPDGYGPVHVAALHGHVECLTLLINHAPQLLEARDIHGLRPLMLASCKGHLDAVDYLITKGAHIDAHAGGLFYQTALDLATKFKHLHVVATLINAGASARSQRVSYDSQSILPVLKHKPAEKSAECASESSKPSTLLGAVFSCLGWFNQETSPARTNRVGSRELDATQSMVSARF